MKTKLRILVAGVLLATVGTGLSQPCITITTEPQGQASCAGSLITLSVVATGAEPLRYQWQQAFDLFNYVDRPEGNNSTLVITNPQNLDAGNYRVIITNAECSVTSAVALLTLVPTPIITAQPTNFAASLCGSVANRVALNTPAVVYQWRFNGTDLPGQTKNTISLTNLQTANEGSYDVVVTNMCGSVTSSAVTLTIDPTFVRINDGPGGTEAAGSIGAAWGDYDKDGYPDLFFANLTVGTYAANNAFWHNNADSTFTKVTTGRPVLDQGAWTYPYWVDYDNDGDLDLHVLASDTQPDKFYRNDGNGLFTPITPEFVKTAPYGTSRGELCGWSDFNNDGRLDVLIPRNNGNDLLFWGGTNGLFQSMTATAVGSVVSAPSYQVGAIFDYDNDGWQDLLLSPSAGVCRLYHNKSDGFFQQIIGSAVNNDYVWNVAVGDYDNDGDFDLFAPGADAGYRGRLYRNEGNGTFRNVAAQAGVGGNHPQYEQMTTWADYDNDGNLDLFITVYGNDNVMFHNNGDGTFTSVEIGSPLRDGFRRYTPTWVDYDHDGFLDFFMACGNGYAERNYLYRNNLPATGNTNCWLNVRLVGKASNSMGIGAKIRATAMIRGKVVQQLRDITVPGSVTQEDYVAHFGLGDATNVTTLRIEWPSGIVQELQDVDTNQFLTVTEPRRPVLSVTAPSGGVANGSLRADPSRTYRILVSQDLGTWSLLTLVTTDVEGVGAWTDADASTDRRFYKAQLVGPQ